MPIQKTIELYSFDELSDAAKERAREWYRGCIDSNDFSHVIDDFVRVAEMIGITIQTHTVPLHGGGTRRDPYISWDLGRGGYVAFRGEYSHKPDALANITERPQDDELHRIVALLEMTQAHNNNMLSAIITTSGRNETMVIDVSRKDGGDVPAEIDAIVADSIQQLATWFYEMLRTEEDYLTSDEVVDDSIKANEYTFNEYGVRED